LFGDLAPQIQLEDVTAQQIAAYATELGGVRAVIGIARRMAVDSSISGPVSLGKIEAHALAWRRQKRLVLSEIPPELSSFVPTAKWPRLTEAAAA